MKHNIKPAEGKLGILIPGLGAVATTLIAGVEAVRKGISQPIGSVTQMGTIRLGKRTENRRPKIKDFVPLADLNDIVFGGWDVFEDNVYEAASKAKVLDKELLSSIKKDLEAVVPMKAAFDKNYAKNLTGTHVKQGTRYELAQAVISKTLKILKQKTIGDRIVLIWCGSTEIYYEASDVHSSD